MDKSYYIKMNAMLESIKAEAIKPSLLLHACCAPCATYPLFLLKDCFDITIMFNNSNIYPQAEYLRRLSELKCFVNAFNKRYGQKIDIIVPPYQGGAFQEALSPYKDEIEGQKRCAICYKKRLAETCIYANEHQYAYFATVMSISPHKNAVMLNEIGEALAKQYQKTIFLVSDFKKNGGVDIARQMSHEYCLYRQDYCGCCYSQRKK